jgi:hypothetical protein
MSILLFVFCRKYGVDENTIDFIGHSLALHRDDHYLGEPALETVKKVKVTPGLTLTLGYPFF